MPEEAALDEAQAVRTLQRYVARHNRQALTLAALSLALAASLWTVVYLFAYWFTLVSATLVRSFDPNTLLEITNPRLVSPYFPAWFGAGAFIVLAVAHIVGRRVNAAKMRERKLYLLWVLHELFMALPNLTFSIVGNLRAIVRLRRGEAAAAWRILQRVHALGGRLAVARTASELENAERAPRLLALLQVCELLDVREFEQGWFYFLQNREALGPLLRENAART